MGEAPARKIRNFEELATTDLRRAALLIAEAGLWAVDTSDVIEKEVAIDGETLRIVDRRYDLRPVKRLRVVAIGKCAKEAGEALEKALGEKLTDGLVFGLSDSTSFNLKKLKFLSGTHPFPSEANVKATSGVINFLQNSGRDDLVIMVVSGGGSTLLCHPAAGGSFEDEEAMLKKLFAAGATIQEINTIRKHTSLARGGFLTKWVFPARLVSLIFSDVPGDDISFVSSGPTVKDETTISDAKNVFSRYGIPYAESGLIETPKDEKYFEKEENIVLVSNSKALEAMASKVGELGLSPEICSTNLAGEARDVGQSIIKKLHGEHSGKVLLYGGETTVMVKGPGPGGRNQELALSVVDKIEDGEVLLALASDGKDNGQYAGAVVDLKTRLKAEELGVSPKKHLDENSSAVFFEKVGGLIVTGPTNSNVADLIIALKDK